LDSTLLILQHRLKEKAQGREIAIVKEYGNLPSVECYPGLLNQAFMNILANAIDALEESVPEASPSISIRTRLEDGRAVIEIADSGNLNDDRKSASSHFRSLFYYQTRR
jgi:signal transduction histidine kinase